MTEREQIEAQIHDLLREELPSVVMSNRLFSPLHGLFCRIGPTEAERRAILQTELWKLAQDRLHELERKEIEHRRVARTTTRPEPADTTR